MISKIVEVYDDTSERCTGEMMRVGRGESGEMVARKSGNISGKEALLIVMADWQCLGGYELYFGSEPHQSVWLHEFSLRMVLVEIKDWKLG